MQHVFADSKAQPTTQQLQRRVKFCYTWKYLGQILLLV